MSWKIKAFLLSSLSLAAIILFWGVVVEPRLIDRTDYLVEIPNLPPQWQGKEVAFFTDMQTGMWLDNEGTVKRIIHKVIEKRPAAVLVGGDFLYHPIEDGRQEAKEEFGAEEEAEVGAILDRVIDIFRPLGESRLPVYAVLGNHDYAMENKGAFALPWVAQELSDRLQQIGISVLQNDSVILPNPAGTKNGESTPLYLIGIGAHYPNNDHVKEAFSGVPENAPRIVLMHHPQTFTSIPAGAAPLAMAGHTHGGQIRIPFLEGWSWMALIEGGEMHVDGWIHDYGQPGNRIYVNRGIGFSVIPMRINCLPELTYFTLVQVGFIKERL